MSRRRDLVTAAACLAVAAAIAGCSHGPQESAGTDDPNRPADVASDAAPRCRRELAELNRRDEAGSIDWEAIEGPDEEPTDEQPASVMIESEPVAGDVVAAGERPTFPDFPDRLDVATLSDVELAEAVDTCYEIGVLVEEEEAGA